MDVETFLDAYGRELADVAQGVYDGRRAFLAEQFQGYVEDTYYVVGEEYVCWPAQTDGSFECYDELCPAERAAIEPLEELGFRMIGCGVARVVLASPPEAGDHVLKIGRCGMTDRYGDGRQANLIERQLSVEAGPDAPILPCRYCSPQGEFAVSPETERILADGATLSEVEAETGAEIEAETEAIRRWLESRLRDVDVAEAVAPENLAFWDGRLVSLDYSHIVEPNPPRGVPDHVDGCRVIEAVDRLRREGRKHDVKPGGGLADPTFES